MQYRTSVKLLRNLTQSECVECVKFNRRASGSMMYDLMRHRDDDDWYAVRVLRHPSRELLGWCLVEPAHYGRRQCGFYVRKEYRRMGIGTMLVRTANKRFGALTATAWNRRNGAFFHANGFEVRVHWGYGLSDSHLTGFVRKSACSAAS